MISALRVPLSRTYRRLLGGEPSLALTGGEDYELLCTVPERKVEDLESHVADLGCPVTCIGEITRGDGTAGLPALDALE